MEVLILHVMSCVSLTIDLRAPDGRRAASNLIVLLVPQSVRELFRCRILRPLFRLLRGGVTPRRLAWSLALGMVIGINPSVGLTTLLVLMLAWAFGLNQVASHIGSYAVAPLHLLLQAFVITSDSGVGCPTGSRANIHVGSGQGT